MKICLRFCTHSYGYACISPCFETEGPGDTYTLYNDDDVAIGLRVIPLSSVHKLLVYGDEIKGIVLAMYGRHGRVLVPVLSWRPYRWRIYPADLHHCDAYRCTEYDIWRIEPYAPDAYLYVARSGTAWGVISALFLADDPVEHILRLASNSDIINLAKCMARSAETPSVLRLNALIGLAATMLFYRSVVNRLREIAEHVEMPPNTRLLYPLKTVIEAYDPATPSVKRYAARMKIYQPCIRGSVPVMCVVSIRWRRVAVDPIYSELLAKALQAVAPRDDRLFTPRRRRGSTMVFRRALTQF